MRIYKPHPITHWTDAVLRHALEECQQAGTSIRKLEKKYGVPKSTLNWHIKNGNKRKVERKNVFIVEEESELKDCIVKLADLGFPLVLKGIGELVESFVNINNIEIAKNILKVWSAQRSSWSWLDKFNY